MSQLQHIQQQFWNQLRSRNTAEGNILNISNHGNINSKNRLNIYQQTTRTAHISALAQCYHCCETILGTKYFNQLANEYYYRYPSTDQDLNNYGKYFPDFLISYINDHVELNDYQYLADLSQLEKSYHLAYFSKDENNFDFQSLSSLDSGSYQNICFIPSSAVSIQKSEFPIYDIWHANQSDDSKQDINAICEAQYLCIYRKDIHPEIDEITFQQWWALKYILLEFSLSEMEHLIAQNNIDIPLDSIIPQLIQKELLCSFTLKHAVHER